MRRVLLIVIIVVVVLVILGVIGSIAGGGSGGVGAGDMYYSIGGDSVPSVGSALGEPRKVQGSRKGTEGGIETLSVAYSVPGMSQAAEVGRYLDFLCSYDGFIAREGAAAAQVWRNSMTPGYMVVVQADYDTSGYTISVMRGAGQVAGSGMPGGYDGYGGYGGTDEYDEFGGYYEGDIFGGYGDDGSTDGGYEGQVFGGGTGGSGTGGSGASGGSGPDNGYGLVPAGEPKSTLSQNGLDIAIYADGTVSVAGGQAVVKPDGTIYINGNKKESNGKIKIPTEGSSIESNGVTLRAVGGEFYVTANGSVLYIDAQGTGSAWDAP